MELRPGAARIPLQALASSFVLHLEVVFFGLFILPLLPSPRVVPLRLNTTQLVATQAEARLTLPAFTPPSPAARAPTSPAPTRSSRSESASLKPGLIFSGPQEIVSLPPHPDNLLQTVRQPDLPTPPRLKVPVAAANILQIAAPVRPILAQGSVVSLQANSQRRITTPVQPSEQAAKAKLNLPVSGDSLNRTVSTLAANDALQPRLAAQPPAATVSGVGADQRNLLVLNALPSSSPADIPAGELAGAFVVSPNPESDTRIIAATSPGTTAGTSGSIPSAKSGKTGENFSAITTGATPAADNHPKDNHANSGSNGGGKAGASAQKNGNGGNGNLSANIAIAQAPNLRTGNAVPRLAIPHGIYGMTIVANGSTGGGLKDYGVFKNEVVYTVYVQMSEPGLPRSNWTLQYAAPSLPPNTLLSPPFPIEKEYPNLPRQVAVRNAGRTIVVAGTITKDGKFDSLRIIQSPNPLLIQPMLDCLAKWSFQAAEINGEAVTVKFVLGVPVALDPEEMK
jgi:hypothetical protein